MFHLTSVAIVLSVVAGTSGSLVWVSLIAGDPLPNNTVTYLHAPRYVGRARHFNDILPAEIYPGNSTAVVRVCGKIVTKNFFEVLTASKPYFWSRLQNGENLPEGLVVGGHEDGRRPLFIASSRNSQNQFPAAYNLNTIRNNGWHALVYPTDRVWHDVSAKNIPKNAVLAGKSTKGHDIFVARLKHQCQLYPGQVIQEERRATAIINEKKLAALYSQVLIGEPDQYSWVSVSEDNFPSNPVVGSTDTTNLYYIAKNLSSNSSTYVTNLFMDGIDGYQILIENVRKVDPVFTTPAVVFENYDYIDGNK